MVRKASDFDEALDAIERLPLEQQADLVDLVQKRLSERRRQEVAESVRAGQTEFAQGTLKPKSVDEIMNEIRP